MKKYFDSSIGTFRTIAFLEGISLLVLIFVGMPLKYMKNEPILVETLGPVHGFLFMLFIYLAFRMAITFEWKFIKTVLIMVSSFIPFGTFIVDYKVLRELHRKSKLEKRVLGSS